MGTLYTVSAAAGYFVLPLAFKRFFSAHSTAKRLKVDFNFGRYPYRS